MAAHVGVRDPLEVDHVRKPEDPPDHLAGRIAQHVVVQRIDIVVPGRFQRRGIGGLGEHRRRIGVSPGLMGPQVEKPAAKRLPEHIGLVENPLLIRDAIVARGVRGMPGLGVPAEQQIAEERPQVESDGAVEGELRIDHASVVLRHHHGTGMQVPVDERLGLIEKFLSQTGGAHLERPVAPQVRGGGIELRRGVAIALARPIGIGEYQVHADPDQRLVGGEPRHSVHLRLKGTGQIRCEKAGAGHVLPHVAREIGIAPPFDQTVPQDDVRREPFHDGAIEVGIVVIDLGNEPADVRRDGAVVRILEVCPVEGHRPGRAGGADIGQRLLGAHRPLRALHDEHQVHIAVPHFADLPGFRHTAQARAHAVDARKQREERRIGNCLRIIHDQSSLRASGSALPPNARSGSAASCLP